MELALLGALGSLGYYLNKDGRADKKKVNDKLVSQSEQPSATNIYQSRFMEKVFGDELSRATKAHQDSMFPMDTGRVNGATYKTYQNNKWDRRTYTKSDRIVQKEKDLKRAEPDTTTKFPSSSLNEFDKTYSMIGAKTVEDIGTKTFNEKRNNIPNPEFEAYPNGDNKPIFRTAFSNPDGTGKGVKVFEKGHNNMEPFFGGSVKQNLRVDANRTLLEHHTGTNPVFKHKKEVKRMFPVVKNPYAVGGLPVSNNRETDRYIPSIKKTNILPFEQKRVAPGLNKSMTEDTSTIGFHDNYRPLGQGKYKPVNELRVNPKITYKGRIAGEGFFVPKQEKARPVISRQPVDLSFTNFKPGANLRGKEGFANTQNENISQNYKYRDTLANGTQVKKGKVNSQDAIVLKNTDRIDYAHKIENFKGHARDERSGHQTNPYDEAKGTVRQQTEDHKHSHINTYGEVKKNQVNPYDEAKGTIKQQTQDHKHSHINRNDGDRRGQTYWFDNAKQTIKQQTEDHKHSHINRGDGDRRGQTYWFDGAKETIKEQTEDHKHSHINTGSREAAQAVHRGNYQNAEINGLKEHTLHRREPTQQGAKAIPGKHLVNNDVRKTQYSTYDKSRRVAPSAPRAVDKRFIGRVTNQKNNYDDKGMLESRIHPEFTAQFRNNPYTQSLNSYQVPYNPAFPIKSSQRQNTSRR
jgi:hypothetical protein